MDSRTRRLFVIVLVAVIAISGGAAVLLGGGPGPVGGGPPGTSSVEGVIVGVDSRSLADVRAFELRTMDGQILGFSLAALENGLEFPPGHLVEHQATAEPVRVWYRDDAGTLLAIRVDDAPRP